MKNKFSRIIATLNKAPDRIRPYLLTKAFSSKVKFAGTTGIRIQSISQQEVIIKLANKRKVQNHIGGIHAIAAAVIAESATGIVFGMNVPDNALPLLKSMTMEYQRRMEGDITARAYLSEEQCGQIQAEERGSLIIPVEITDSSEQQPIQCTMEWAWVPKKR